MGEEEEQVRRRRRGSADTQEKGERVPMCSAGAGAHWDGRTDPQKRMKYEMWN